MKVDVLWTPLELEHVSVQDRTAVLVDAIRSATTIATAIHNGAGAVLPAGSIEEAMRLANSLGRDEVLLCGERQGVKIDGFDLGNSPAEYTQDAVTGRTVIISTTNGTRTLASLSSARRTFVAAFVNLTMVARRLQEEAQDTAIVCAGRQGRVSVEDALCAGQLIQVWRDSGSTELDLGDGALAALALASNFSPVNLDFMRATEAGRALTRIGLADDLGICARTDSVPAVPVLDGPQLVSLEP